MNIYMVQIHNIVLSASHTQTKNTNTILMKITHTFSVTIILIPMLSGKHINQNICIHVGPSCPDQQGSAVHV